MNGPTLIDPEAHNVKSRERLPELVQRAGFVAGERHAVELGVASGDFSYHLLEARPITSLIANPTGRIFSTVYLVDRWTDPHHSGEEYFKVVSRFRTRPRACVLRATFEEALSFFSDNSLTFVYVDGYAHTGQEGGKTLEDWWAKLKPGAIFSGHDYHPDWQPTVDAVDKFCESKGMQPTICGKNVDKYPSWWVQKPLS